MFAKPAKMSAPGLRRAVARLVVPSLTNDNRIDNTAASRRSRRPRLVCRWRPVGGGRLECCWIVEFVDLTATDEPDGRWLFRGIRRMPGIEIADRRLAVPMMG
jgi:hypothetical protein